LNDGFYYDMMIIFDSGLLFGQPCILPRAKSYWV